jgi:uncharacterized protein (TIGR00251 family)
MSGTAAAVVIRPVRTGVRFDVRVLPRGSRTGIEGVRDGAVVVRVTAPPVDGAANAALTAAVADALKLAKREVQIVSGGRSRRKTIEVASVSVPELRARLSAILG